MGSRRLARVSCALVLAAVLAGLGPVVVVRPESPGPTALSPLVTSATLRPSSVGNASQWSRFACATNWQCVNETISNGDATYVYGNATGKSDLYALQDLAPGGNVTSVTVYAVARAVTAKSCRPNCQASIQLRILTHGTNYSSSNKVVGTSYATVSHSWTTNPYTGAAWTVSEVNALQAGELSSALQTPSVRVTQVYVVVVLG